MVKHLTMALLAMVIYGALHISLGRIPVANGWDGIDYLVTGSPAQAFDVTNYVFTGLLAFLFSLLMEWYGASSLARWRPRQAMVLMSAVVVLTLATQMPFQGMDLTRYFTEWFPYYACDSR